MINLEDLPDGVFIKPGAFVAQGPVPVYLPDRTAIGTATIVETEDGVYAQIQLKGGAWNEILKEQLVGFSVVALAGHPGELVDQINEKKEESNDGD